MQSQDRLSVSFAFRVQTLDEAELVDDLGGMRKKLRDPLAAFAVLGPVPFHTKDIHDGYLNENVQDSLNGSGDSKTRIERNHLLLQKSLIETPNDPYLWFQLGMNFFSAGDFEKSKKALAEAEKLGIHRETEIVRRRFHLRRAQMFLREDHYKDALQEASAGYEVLPGPDVAYVALAASGWMNNVDLVKYWGERFLSHSKNDEKIKEVKSLLDAMNLS